MLEGLESVGMAGDGPAMQQVAALIRQVAPTDLSVLILGESGTGKELVARAIHENSRRAGGPLITVNCGAIPEGIFESEIFGHERGSFTGAERQRKGMFELADGGTIFLDEIGEMPLFTQVKILRVLETGEFMRVGGQTTVRVNVRVVAATNRDLAREAARGRFRQDLFFRLKAVAVQLPPLRERREDIPLLIDRFVARMNRLRDRAVAGIDQEALALLMGHSYPGNIRELENIIEHAFVLCGNDTIGIRHLPAGIVILPRGHVDQPVLAGGAANLESAVSSTETRVILEALERNGYNRRATAEELGMHTTTLFRRLRRLGLQLPERDGRSVRKPKN